MSTPTIRRYKDKLVYVLGVLCVALATIPLISIIVEVVRNGASALSIGFFTNTPGIIGQVGGGIANSIQGTLILIGLTSLIGVPLGLISGVYLAEFGDNRFGRTIRFLNDVLTEFPSIVIGILVFSVVVLTIGNPSAIAGAIALSIIMLPVVTRTTEESLKVVPTTIRDAAMALGIRRWRTTVSVVLSTARGGVVTGIMLSVARVAGETAPLILTVLGSDFFFAGLNRPIDALPLRVWRFALLCAGSKPGCGYDFARQQGWGAALVLILIVLVLNVTVKVATRGKCGAMRSRL